MSFIAILNIIYIVHNEWENCTFWTEFINSDYSEHLERVLLTWGKFWGF